MTNLESLLDLVGAKSSEDMSSMERYMHALPDSVSVEQRKVRYGDITPVFRQRLTI